jgi:hypothetical protein
MSRDSLSPRERLIGAASNNHAFEKTTTKSNGNETSKVIEDLDVEIAAKDKFVT